MDLWKLIVIWTRSRGDEGGLGVAGHQSGSIGVDTQSVPSREPQRRRDWIARQAPSPKVAAKTAGHNPTGLTALSKRAVNDYFREV